MIIAGTVGVAPGTTTLALGAISQGVSARSINWIKQRPDAPEEKRWMFYDRDYNGPHRVAYPTGFKGLGQTVYRDPYANDLWRLRGLRGRDNIRWDLIGVIGGGALGVSLLIGLVAAKLKL